MYETGADFVGLI